MSEELTNFQKQLCNLLQDGLTICRRPFAEIAKTLNCNEDSVLEQTRLLKETGIIRRFHAIINYRALGRTSSLIAAHVPDDSFEGVTNAVNDLEGVSHNYRRDHHYNMWFTLQMQTLSQIETLLAELSERFGTEFHSLPVERAFKLDVRFDAERLVMRGITNGSADDIRRKIEEPVELNEIQKHVLSGLQKDLEFTAEPFEFLNAAESEDRDVRAVIQELVNMGVIRRIAAVLNHRRIGFECNVLFVCEISLDRIITAGRRLARTNSVSHCYQRKTFKDWPYNLFAMMHGRDEAQIRHDIEELVEIEKIEKFELLKTVAELKKQPVRYNL